MSNRILGRPDRPPTGDLATLVDRLIGAEVLAALVLADKPGSGLTVSLYSGTAADGVEGTHIALFLTSSHDSAADGVKVTADVDGVTTESLYAPQTYVAADGVLVLTFPIPAFGGWGISYTNSGNVLTKFGARVVRFRSDPGGGFAGA